MFAQGPVGLMATAGAKFRGAGLIIGVDSIPKRQELSRFYGADLIIDPTSPTLLQTLSRSAVVEE